MPRPFCFSCILPHGRRPMVAPTDVLLICLPVQHPTKQTERACPFPTTSHTTRREQACLFRFRQQASRRSLFDLRRSSMQHHSYAVSSRRLRSRRRFGVQGLSPWRGGGAEPLPAGGPRYPFASSANTGWQYTTRTSGSTWMWTRQMVWPDSSKRRQLSRRTSPERASVSITAV